MRLTRSHIVITSYSVVASEYANYIPVEDEEGRPVKGKKKAAAPSSSDSGSETEDSDDSGGPSNKQMLKALAPKKSTYRTSSNRKDALFRVRWWRIVLGSFSCYHTLSFTEDFTDEAHNIKNRNTKSAIACCALKGKYRWCLTGTPM